MIHDYNSRVATLISSRPKRLAAFAGLVFCLAPSMLRAQAEDLAGAAAAKDAPGFGAAPAAQLTSGLVPEDLGSPQIGLFEDGAPPGLAPSLLIPEAAGVAAKPMRPGKPGPAGATEVLKDIFQKLKPGAKAEATPEPEALFDDGDKSPHPSQRRSLSAQAAKSLPRIRQEIAAFAQGSFSQRQTPPAGLLGKDLTREFAQARSRALSAQELRQLRHKTTLVFVGGFLSNHQKNIAHLGGEPLSRNLAGIQKLAADLRIAHRAAGTNTEQSSEYNARRLIAIVREEARKGRRIVFISHSHGCLDVLRALESLESSPAERRLLDAVSWIPIQAPFLGVPMADKVAAAHYHNAVFLGLALMGGSRQSLIEMTTEAAARHYAGHRGQIRRILGRVATIAVAGYLHAPRALESTKGLLPLLVKSKVISAQEGQDIASGKGAKTDGMIPLSSQFFPEMDRVVLKDLAHYDALGIETAARDRRVITGLLRMILARDARIRLDRPRPG